MEKPVFSETASYFDDFISTKIYCARWSRDYQIHFWSLLSSTTKAFSRFMIYLKTVAKRVANIKWASKSLWNLMRIALLLEAVLV